MKVKDLLKVVDKDYLNEVKLYERDYEFFIAWDKWDSLCVQQYKDRKIIKFTWYHDDLWIYVED